MYDNRDIVFRHEKEVIRYSKQLCAFLLHSCVIEPEKWEYAGSP